MASGEILTSTVPGPAGRARLAGLIFSQLSDSEDGRVIIEAVQAGWGSRVAGRNIDTRQQIRRDPVARILLGRGALIAPDGGHTPWLARLRRLHEGPHGKGEPWPGLAGARPGSVRTLVSQRAVSGALAAHWAV